MKLLSNYIVAPSLPGHFLIQLHSNHVVIHSVPKVAPAPASPPNWAKKTVAELPHPAARARLENALQVITPILALLILPPFYLYFTPPGLHSLPGTRQRSPGGGGKFRLGRCR